MEIGLSATAAITKLLMGKSFTHTDTYILCQILITECVLANHQSLPKKEQDDETVDPEYPHRGDFPTDNPDIIVHVIETQDQEIFYFTTNENYEQYVST